MSKHAAIFWHIWSVLMFVFVVVAALGRTGSNLEAIITALALLHFWVLGGLCAMAATKGEA